jgi:ribosome-binding factor A
MKFIPRLLFKLDDQSDELGRIDELIDTINQ